jgi:hypothetical protein
MTVIGVFALIVGVGIVGLWIMLLSTHQVPEIETGDRAIWFHITAESLLGVVLIVSGALLLLGGEDQAARILAAAALGGMVYSAVNSSGYYAAKANWPVVGAFMVLAIVGAFCVGILLLP